MPPFILFNLQFVFALVAYGLFAAWIVAPRLAQWPREAALVRLLRSDFGRTDREAIACHSSASSTV